MDNSFGALDWHDAVLLSIRVDRRRAGEADEVVLELQWPNGDVSAIRFLRCLALKAEFNFGVSGPDTILGAWVSDDSDLCSRLRAVWGPLGGDVAGARSYMIELNSTGSILEVVARDWIEEASSGDKRTPS